MPVSSLSDHLQRLFPEEAASPCPARDSGSEVRQKERAAAWRAQIARAYAYMAGRARTTFEQDQLAEAYAQALGDRPDFARVHRESSFSPAPVRAYDRNEAHRIMSQARAIERGTYQHRAKGEHGGIVGRSALRLLETLLFVMWPIAKKGMFPSLAHLAAKAQMSVRTVQTALAVLRLLGFLTILRRVKRVQTALGLQQQQDTNAYLLHLPKGLGAIGAALFSSLFPDGKKFQAKESISNLYGFEPANPSFECGVRPLTGPHNLFLCPDGRA